MRKAFREEYTFNGVKFSDRKTRIAGVRITPRWAWSDDYKAWLRGVLTDPMPAEGEGPSKRAQEERASRYVSWWLEVHGYTTVPHDIEKRIAEYQESGGAWPCPCGGRAQCPHAQISEPAEALPARADVFA